MTITLTANNSSSKTTLSRGKKYIIALDLNFTDFVFIKFVTKDECFVGRIIRVRALFVKLRF